MSKRKSELLIIIGSGHLSEVDLAKLTADARVVEWLDENGRQTVTFAPIGDGSRRLDKAATSSSQLGQAFNSSVIRAEDLQAEMKPGEALTASSFAIDPLESAIDQAVRLIAECQGNQEVRLTSHLDQLLALQLKRAERAG